MRRRVPLRRTISLRQCYQRKLLTGAPRAQGRLALPLKEWLALRRRILQRNGGRCQACHLRKSRDPHHVQKRSQGGADHPDNLVALCRRCHDLVDRPYAEGRLEIIALGHERFRFIRRWRRAA